ncbi:phosphoglucosamine mutase [Porticoccaceae bacterium]|jgi:phosphoglucosamine mutase|nr:phosphoglucosamine mutase [Porticoccaceae bacterium]MDB2621205.1 phosphoglucosamine mutase [Porticoccaceae bacterium]MDB2669437.1 phosphoglucosamine mutase [Porticoccaceae bacterium]MDC0524460.1 phosphoglucosamine mutase [Porticoccaceae bacterium]|tara:strand:+ start:5256 stop:6599 length:1344 start_codon:yes stop_codon:yes gene_type:complete
MSRKYFGTDGIRGTVGQHPITADFMLKLGYAAGKVLTHNTKVKKRVLIGKDTRVSGYMFESALEAGLIAAGVNVDMLGPMPTPAIAYLTRAFRASAGIVISASHNPVADNGIKFFSADGFKLDDDIELEIEALIDQPLITNDSFTLGKARRISDATGRYVEFCKGSLPSQFNLAGFKIVLDCANGATYNAAPKVFKELGAHTITMATEPNGFNINDKCGSTYMEGLCARVVEENADFGIALDGDGDRVLFSDANGEIVDGDELIYIIAQHRLQSGQGCNGVAGTLMSNLGLELALKDLNIPFLRTKVGDRYVVEALKDNDWNLGGEASGHVLCSDLNTTGDGIVAALQVIRAISDSGKPLADLKLGMSKFPQTMINVRLAKKVDITENNAINAAVAEAEQKLAGRGRVLLRPSGTEPLIRVMAEGDDQALVEQQVKAIAKIVEQQVG